MTRTMLIAAICLCLAAPALAQLTVATDRQTYIAGDTVEITIHNGGPSVAMFVGTPLYSITRVESGTVVYGETLVPEITYFAVGRTEVYRFVISDYPHEPGHYRIDLHVLSADPGSILATTYILDPAVASEQATLSRIKAMAR